MGGIGRGLLAIISRGITEDCDDDTRTTRRVFTGASLFVGVAGPIWGCLYIAFGEPASGLIPLLYGVFTLTSLGLLGRVGAWEWFRISQTLLILVLPIALMLSLGGYIPGSAVVIWAVLAPIGSLWEGRSRAAVGWTCAFLIGAVASGIIDPYLRDSNELPDALVTWFFVMNVTFVSSAILLLLNFFVGQKDTMISIMRRNRELESEYLAQEVALRQNDKLATLGKLSAGMAHELNNPTAAAQQATQQLGGLLLSEEREDFEIACLDLGEAEAAALGRYTARISDAVEQPQFLDPLERSDRELAVQEHLEGAGLDDAWELAPSLSSSGLGVTDLVALADEVRPDRYAGVVGALATRYENQSLVRSLAESTDRIIEIVRALKSYTYLDQAPSQFVDVHEGLDSTLVMLQGRLKVGIEVDRAYDDDLPLVQAHGSELNQVWTNILDNAIDAMDGHGSIVVSTHGDHGVVVEITDDGPGIPTDLVDHIFDPFVTSKPPGEGTGLGLNIAHNIITAKHGGEISVSSVPGRTTFTVRLPVRTPTNEDSAAETSEPPPGDHVQGRA